MSFLAEFNWTRGVFSSYKEINVNNIDLIGYSFKNLYICYTLIQVVINSSTRQLICCTHKCVSFSIANFENSDIANPKL